MLSAAPNNVCGSVLQRLTSSRGARNMKIGRHRDRSSRSQLESSPDAYWPSSSDTHALNMHALWETSHAHTAALEITWYALFRDVISEPPSAEPAAADRWKQRFSDCVRMWIKIGCADERERGKFITRQPPQEGNDDLWKILDLRWAAQQQMKKEERWEGKRGIKATHWLSKLRHLLLLINNSFQHMVSCPHLLIHDCRWRQHAPVNVKQGCTAGAQRNGFHMHAAMHDSPRSCWPRDSVGTTCTRHWVASGYRLVLSERKVYYLNSMSIREIECLLECQSKLRYKVFQCCLCFLVSNSRNRSSELMYHSRILTKWNAID